MQSGQEFCQCLASDAAIRALRRIQEIVADDTLSDPECFWKIEAIVTVLEDLGLFCGGRHDFG